MKRITYTLVGATAVVVWTLASTGAAGAQVPDYTPETVSVSPNTVVVGQTITITGTGWTPGSVVTVTFESDPVNLGSATADEVGRIALQAQTPSVPLGTHVIRATSGADEALTTILVVSPSQARAAGTLARTGSSHSLPLARMALGLMAFGGLIVAASRRRVGESTGESIGTR
jgi:hypothetical protein